MKVHRRDSAGTVEVDPKLLTTIEGLAAPHSAAPYSPGPYSAAPYSSEEWAGEQQSQSMRWLSSVTAPPRNDEVYYRVCCQLKRHLREPRKPLIVVLAESSGSELFQQAIAAYGRSSPLRSAADLVLAVVDQADQADGSGDRSERAKPLLLALDRHDLYGNVALYSPGEPGEEVIELLRVARDRRGVLVVAESNATADDWTGEAANPSLALELLSSDLGVPVISADAANPTKPANRADTEELADQCGSIVVDPDSWAELSRETQQMAADRRLQICRTGYSALGRRLLESRRRRNARPSGGRYPLMEPKPRGVGKKVSVVDTAAAAAG